MRRRAKLIRQQMTALVKYVTDANEAISIKKSIKAFTKILNKAKKTVRAATKLRQATFQGKKRKGLRFLRKLRKNIS